MQFKQDVDDKRNSVRLDFKVPVELCCVEMGKWIFGELENLSVHGMLVRLRDEIEGYSFDVQGSFTARIVFPGKGSSLMIDQLQATVVRMNDNFLALEFIEPLEWFLLFNVYKGKQTHT